MTAVYDVAVAGLGAMGSASLLELARAGLRVIGFERHESPHAMGSSHGGSRIIREAYFEDPCYVPLVQRAYERWAALERDADRRLLLETGGLMLGPEHGDLVAGVLRSAREHDLAHELLEAARVRDRFPALRPEPDMVGVLEPRAGVLFPEQCIAAQLELATRAGAEARMREPVLEWHPLGSGVEVRTARGRYQAGHLVLTAGAWMPALLPGVALPLAIERQVQAWFEPAGDPRNLESARCPVTIWEYEAGRYFYAFPLLDGAVKAAIHHQGEITEPDALRREVTESDVKRIRAPMARHMPDAAGRCRDSRACMYSNTPDGHFVIDHHPAQPQVVIVSACSGHGFKFATAVGAAVADLVTGKRPAVDLGRFRLDRFPARDATSASGESGPGAQRPVSRD